MNKETDEIFEITFKEFYIKSENHIFPISYELIRDIAGYFFHRGCGVGIDMTDKKVNELLKQNKK